MFLKEKINKFKYWLIDLSDLHYYLLLQRELKDCTSVLDVGCGSGSPLGRVKKTFYSEGIDIFGPDIKTIKKKKIHDKYTLGNILQLEKFYKDKSFDAVILLDVIEHLTKKNGWELMKKMEKIAKKKVIIVTPNGFLPQQPKDDNPYQEHISGWTVKDFKSKKYICFGMRGFKPLLGEHASLKYRPWIIWGTISVLSQLIFYFIPLHSFHLMAVKNQQ